MICEALTEARERFEFVRDRDGLEAAETFARQATRCYRASVLDPTKYGMYKRSHAAAYRAFKQILEASIKSRGEK